MALQYQPYKDMVARRFPDHPQVADSSFSQKSNLALSILSPRNLGQAASGLNDKGLSVTDHCGPTSAMNTAAQLPVAIRFLLVNMAVISVANWLLTLSIKCKKSIKKKSLFNKTANYMTPKI